MYCGYFVFPVLIDLNLLGCHDYFLTVVYLSANFLDFVTQELMYSRADEIQCDSKLMECKCIAHKYVKTPELETNFSFTTLKIVKLSLIKYSF